MPEYVYILTNPAMPEWVKIGETTITPAQRAAALFTTAVPCRFQVFAYLEIEQHAEAVETAIHGILETIDKKLRAIEPDGAKREFFALSEDAAYEILRRVKGIITSQGGMAKLVKPQPTAEEIADQEIANFARIRSGRDPGLWLKRLGISDDDELTCTKPDKDGNAVKIKAKRCAHGVYGEWQGEEMPLLAVFREICGVTKSAEKFLTDAFDADKTAMGERLYSIGNVRATTRVLWFWKYNDRTLLEIYAERIAQESEEQGE